MYIKDIEFGLTRGAMDWIGPVYFDLYCSLQIMNQF